MTMELLTAIGLFTATLNAVAGNECIGTVIDPETAMVVCVDEPHKMITEWVFADGEIFKKVKLDSEVY